MTFQLVDTLLSGQIGMRPPFWAFSDFGNGHFECSRQSSFCFIFSRAFVLYLALAQFTVLAGPPGID